ncbi:MAG: GWxTD domain-containing protein [Flammeovirgaceae bacterium]|nr:GWxTD domain-containing protein [Flammeovirgaceae bacterium]
MKIFGYLILLILIGWHNKCHSQALSGTNFNYLYNPLNEISFQHKVVNEKNKITLYYSLTTSGQQKLSDYQVDWEKRESLSSKTGNTLPLLDSVIVYYDEKVLVGKMSFSVPASKWYALVTVTEKDKADRWSYFAVVDPKYPNEAILVSAKPIFDPFLSVNENPIVSTEKPNHLYGFYYQGNFDSALPPFIIDQKSSDRFLFADSTFATPSNEAILFSKQGLYLIQQDTQAVSGLAFRINNESFPKFTQVKELIGPLIYISTQEEFTKLINTNGEKAKFDEIILEITGDVDRARNFIRSYYRRVEYVNKTFSSYKEGWKTDRGMVYLIYGQPDEVVFGEGTETWFYKSSKLKFNFVKSGTIYDPDNHVLVRDKEYARSWYQTVDLWRKSRF